MSNDYMQIQELLHQRADYQARLKLLPYDGTPEARKKIEEVVIKWIEM